jgi:hypothetical protein
MTTPDPRQIGCGGWTPPSQHAKEKADDRLARMACSGWVGRLSHDRSKHADWGWLRDDAGELIVIVKMPFMEEEELHEHRRNGTDPAQPRVDAILAALYGQNSFIQ